MADAVKSDEVGRQADLCLRVRLYDIALRLHRNDARRVMLGHRKSP